MIQCQNSNNFFKNASFLSHFEVSHLETVVYQRNVRCVHWQ